MKTLKKLALLLPIFCGAYSCSNPHKQVSETYSSFGQTESLNSERHKVGDILMYPRNLFLTDSTIVVYNEKTDTIFQVFDKHSFTFQYSFGRKGEGPNEFVNSINHWVEVKKDGITLLDVFRLKEISLKNGQPVIQTYGVPHKASYFNNLIALKDSAYVCDAGLEEEKGRFMLIRPDSTTQFFGEYPESSERFESVLMRNQAYVSTLVGHPEGEKFAAFYCNTRGFSIFDASGKLLHQIKLDIQPQEKEISTNAEQRYMHTIAAYATNDYIYTLNLDMTFEEIAAQKQNPNIQVFSWEGEPLKQYNLDCYISSFAVDESNATIYGVFAEDENATIYTFKMK